MNETQLNSKAINLGFEINNDYQGKYEPSVIANNKVPEAGLPKFLVYRLVFRSEILFYLVIHFRCIASQIYISYDWIQKEASQNTHWSFIIFKKSILLGPQFYSLN